MDKQTKDKLDKIIELLEGIRANQPIPYNPPFILWPIVPPEPYVIPPYYPDPYQPDIGDGSTNQPGTGDFNGHNPQPNQCLNS